MNKLDPKLIAQAILNASKPAEQDPLDVLVAEQDAEDFPPYEEEIEEPWEANIGKIVQGIRNKGIK